MHACFQEMEMKWRSDWEDLTSFTPGGGGQKQDLQNVYNGKHFSLISPLVIPGASLSDLAP